MAHTYWLYGSELSPFSLKLRAMCDYAALPYTWVPADGTRLQAVASTALVDAARRGAVKIHYPEMSDLDELPLVPFLIEDRRRVMYDSSALATWLDERRPGGSAPLIPTDPVPAFVASWLDEAFDEFGLYLVHHNRWVLSASDNDAGARLGREYSKVTGGLFSKKFGENFARRQVRRLPYLFSVAPEGYRRPGLPEEITPPSRAGFPPTHELLDEAFRLWLEAVEGVLSTQPFVLGEWFTLADASIYGQLMMNLSDPSAAQLIQKHAPHTFDWCRSIATGAHRACRGGEPAFSDSLARLMEVTAQTYGALMQMNEAAWKEALQSGETLFNEKAFNRGRALYDGELLGRPFRHVVKTFQVRSWQDLRGHWQALTETERSRVEQLYPVGKLF